MIRAIAILAALALAAASSAAAQPQPLPPAPANPPLAQTLPGGQQAVPTIDQRVAAELGSLHLRIVVLTSQLDQANAEIARVTGERDMLKAQAPVKPVEKK